MLSTDLRKKRVVGILILAVILAVFLSLNRFPKLDTVREDLDAVTGPQVECFQGFCIEHEDDSSFLSRWWSFSITYLELVTIGMVVAFAVAGLTEGFLLPRTGGGATLTGGRYGRIFKGLAVGTVVNLCSACIVPISAARRRRGAGIEGALAILHGSATLNVPSLLMAAVVFTPMLGISRFLLGLTAALLIGPLVVWIVGRSSADSDSLADVLPAIGEPEAARWGPVLREAFIDWARSSFGFLVRLGPIMIVAAFISGLAMQWISSDTVATYLGNNLTGIVIAATFGILINVPLLFEIPLVALLLLLGMGPAPAATLLFTAAAGGPITFWGLASVMPRKAIATLATATWVLGAIGGLAILGYGALTSDDGPILKLGTAEAATTPADTIVPSDRPLFTDATAGAGIEFFHHAPKNQLFPLGAGVVIFDFNGDGLQDVFVPDLMGPNALFQNNGDGTFTESAAAAGIDDPQGEANGGCTADYDNDADQDLFITIHGSNKLFRNNGNGKFADVSADSFDDYDATGRFSGCAWGDYDRDGLLDLIVLSHLGENVSDVLEYGDFYLALRGLTLYHNDGDGSFEIVTDLLGDTSGPPAGGAVGNVYGAGFQPAWVDFDNDGDLDLYVVNDLGSEIQPNVLWRNDGAGPDGTWLFTDISKSSGAMAIMNGMGLAIGDYDLDGHLDIYMTNIKDNVLLKYMSQDNKYEKTTEEAGVGIGLIGRMPRISWGAMFMDYDNDGDEDLYVVSGHLPDSRPINLKEQPNVLLRNQGDGTFVDVSAGSGAEDDGIGRGGAYLDFNADGCLDIVVANYGQQVKLFRNVCDSGNHWLTIKTVGVASNRDGIGARITLDAGGVTQIREVAAGGSQMGQNMLEVHFGLGAAEVVDSVTVRWPSGRVQTITGVSADQRLSIVEPE